MRRVKFLIVAALCGCASWLPASEPMQAVDAERPGPRARCLMVFLPGGGDHAEAFARNGFVEEVQRRPYSIDMVAADATLGYYTRGVVTERLSRDVVLRRVRRGYQALWLVGPSLGGFGTLLYSRQRPSGEVSGVFALAPFLGSDASLFEEIKRAGGLAHWKAPARQEPNANNFAPELWRWLQALTQGSERGPDVYLGYGLDDGLARANALLSDALPKAHVFVGSGGHNWVTWRKLFSEFLDRGPLRERCAAN